MRKQFQRFRRAISLAGSAVRSVAFSPKEAVRLLARPASETTQMYADSARLRAEMRIDVGALNARFAPAPFASFASQVVAAAHFDDEAFLDWFPLVRDGTVRYHRKWWEYAFMLERARQAGVLEPDRRALGFGVGTEPLPAILASWGLKVLATDQAAEDAGEWAESGQHADSLASLSRPLVIDDVTLAERVEFATVDMNEVPDDLGTFDLVWSSCAFEHLGSPQAGLRFVMRSLDYLRPGAVAIHTTEFELTERTETADYGHCAIYRPQDLEQLASEVVERGFEIELNLHVPMATPQDRFIALATAQPQPTDIAHLKLVVGGSISTSIGLAIRKPAADSSDIPRGVS